MSETLDCGHPPSPHSEGGTGYGTQPDGTKHCYMCCALIDLRDMHKDGCATLYLKGSAEDGFRLTNWPGSLTFPVRNFSLMRHSPFRRQRIDAWFLGPDGYVWHAVNKGDMELTKCCRTPTRWQKQLELKLEAAND